MDFKEFEKEAKLKFTGLKLKYYTNKYRGFDKETTITCNRHGAKKVIPRDFLNSVGCEECKKILDDISDSESEESSETPIVRSETYCHFHKREECNVCLGDVNSQKDLEIICSQIYEKNYSFKFNDSNSPVMMNCKKHGSKKRTLEELIYSYRGCDRCSEHNKKKKTEFMSEITRKYKFGYNYSKIVYENESTKVEIVCAKHGLLKIAPKTFRSSGCLECKNL